MVVSGALATGVGEMRWIGMVSVLFAAMLATPGGALAGAQSYTGPPQGSVSRYYSTGTYAQADWYSQTSTGDHGASVSLDAPRHGIPELVVQDTTDVYMPDGEVVTRSVAADVTSGFSFAIDAHTLSGASVGSSGVQATSCVQVIDGWVISTRCKQIALPLSVVWTGAGPILRGVSHDSFVQTTDSLSHHTTGYLYHQVDRASGPTRAASVAAQIGAVTESPQALHDASFGTDTSSTLFLCLGEGCEN